MNRSFLYLLFIVLWSQSNVTAQNAMEIFGKNKIQYNDDLQDWWVYETNSVIYYWYGKSRHLAQFYIEIAEQENTKIQTLFEYHLKEKIEIVIYSDLSDVYQTNLDLDASYTSENWSQEPKVTGQKILLYFDGNHEHAIKLLQKGLIQIYFNALFSGTNLQEVVQKVISLKLPLWFEKGLIDYLGDGWEDNDLDALGETWNQKQSFRKYSAKYPNIAGKSFWRYLVLTYGDQIISNWLYMIRIQKDISQSTRLVFQLTLQNLQEDWKDYYIRELQTNKSNQSTPTIKIKLKKEEQIIKVVFSKIDSNFLLITNQNGCKRIKTLNTKNGKTKTFYKYGYRNKVTLPDFNYPIYFENQIDKSINIIDEKRNRPFIKSYNKNLNKSNKIYFLEDIERIYYAISRNQESIILSATNNGFSDIFEYQLKSRTYNKWTDDIYDDLDLHLKDNINSIFLFKSNRTDTISKINKIDSILPLGPFQLYSINNKLNSKIGNELRVLKDATLDSYSFIDTNYYVLKVNLKPNNIFYLYNNGKKIEMNENQLDLVGFNSIQNEILRVYKNAKNKYQFSLIELKDLILQNNLIEEIDSQESLQQNKSDVESYKTDSLVESTNIHFISKFGDPLNVKNIVQEFENKTVKLKRDFHRIDSKSNIYSGKLNQFNSNLSIAYRNKFQIEEISSTLNNDILFGGLTTYSTLSQNYSPPPLGILLKARVKELFENYFIEVGVRIPTNLVGSESYLKFDFFKKRWDHTIAFYRKVDREIVPSLGILDWQLATKTLLVNYQVKYPWDIYKRFSLNTTIRNDHEYLKAIDKVSLDSAGRNIPLIGTRLEYVFDNSLDLSLNLKQGTQFKIFFETAKRFLKSDEQSGKFVPFNGLLMVLGFDARYHVPILKHSTFSNRIFFNSSFGKDQILSNVGGTENWLLPKYNYEFQFNANSNYAYSQLVTEVRGYPLGSRKGSSSLVWSSEFRFPIIQYLLTQNVKKSFLRNLIIIGFFDSGLSWNGFIPNITEAQKFVYHNENPAVIVDVIINRNPIISGTGIGIRSSLLGYYFRFDYGWPIDLKGFHKPLPHFSLGLDF